MAVLDEKLKIAGTIRANGEIVVIKVTLLKKNDALLDLLREHVAGEGCGEAA